jgi:hypothetical protein
VTAHAERAHSVWSASSTDRNWSCPGALALTIDMPETTSEAADWGTACHQISERCLRNGTDAVDYIGTTEKGKEHSFEVDDEMADCAQMYVDYVRVQRGEQDWLGTHCADCRGSGYNRYDRKCASCAGTGDAHGYKTLLMIEQKFSLAALDPPFDAGGTGDAVIWKPIERQIEVVDLKGGRGVVVEAKGNPQLRTYALGAMLANPGLPVETIKVTIVQPRAGHKDGRIRSETFDVTDLVEWTADLMRAMERANRAAGLYMAIQDGTIDRPMAAWTAEFLNAGAHCKFCKAAGICPALEQKALDAAGVWFDDLDQPRISNAPDTMSPERLAQLLDAADMIGDWINAVRAHAHREAEGGTAIPNYVLVEKEGREKWLDDAAQAKAAAAAAAAGVPADKVFNAPKLRTPKQVRDALKKAKIDPAIVAGLSETPKTGTQLVRATKTTRAAVPSRVEQHFDVLE